MVNDNKSYDADKNNKEDVKYSEGAGAEKVVKGGGRRRKRSREMMYGEHLVQNRSVR